MRMKLVLFIVLTIAITVYGWASEYAFAIEKETNFVQFHTKEGIIVKDLNNISDIELNELNIKRSDIVEIIALSSKSLETKIKSLEARIKSLETK